MLNELSPGAKGWINKYFHLAEKKVFSLKKKCPANLDEAYFMHLQFARSGIVFGFPNKLIFGSALDDRSWTIDEKLKLLLFESHILVFQQKHGSVLKKRTQFLEMLLQFYSSHRSKGLKKYLRLMSRESQEHTLERILAERLRVRTTFREWIYYHSSNNMLCFIDVILFETFVNKNDTEALSNFPLVADSILTAYQLAVNADEKSEIEEKRLFQFLILSSRFSNGERKRMLRKITGELYLEDIKLQERANWLMRRYLLDISVLTIFFNHDEADFEEMEYLEKLMLHLDLPANELEESIVMIENFILKNTSNIEFLNDSHSFEKIYNGLTKRWIKILSRNKDKLATELKESKELVYLIKKSAGQELSKEEKEKVKTQFLDIVKSMPTLAIFMLPGGAVLLPIVLKIIPDLIPSAFRENEVIEEEGLPQKTLSQSPQKKEDKDNEKKI